VLCAKEASISPRVPTSFAGVASLVTGCADVSVTYMRAIDTFTLAVILLTTSTQLGVGVCSGCTGACVIVSSS